MYSKFGSILERIKIMEKSYNLTASSDFTQMELTLNSDNINIFSISKNTYMSDVKADNSRDKLLTDFGKETLSDRYLIEGESYQDAFVRVAKHFSDDEAHAQRMYDYISKQYFMPSTPILSNGGTSRGLPISCFVNEANDTLPGIVDLWTENVWLASRGGGIGSYWGGIRSMGEAVGISGKTSGVVPFIRVMDSLTLAIAQGSLRRGSAAVYLPVSHPEIEEFIELRKPTGGDPNRKTPNLHHGILLSDAFMESVAQDKQWDLVSPKTNEVIRSVPSRDLWIRILTARVETGEPYCVFIDTVNKNIPEHHKLSNLKVKTSNLCAEIMLPTGTDHLGNDRTAVCCLGSMNLETYDEWKDDPDIIEDVMRFLDNVLQDFIENAPKGFEKAVYAAARERSVGLGVMGFHSFLQSKNIPFESVMAKSWNIKMFKHISEDANKASIKLAHEKGACLDAAEYGISERFSNKIAVAPTASISIICGGVSPGIDPISGNNYVHKTLSGSFPVRNRHLKKLLIEKGHDTDDIWSSISVHEGSVQHLDFLTDLEKDVFKTAFEINQRWVIEHAADRAEYICQSQSVNLFLPADVNKTDLHMLHFTAWKKGVKSLYYCRSKSIQRAEVGFEHYKEDKVEQVYESTDYEECLSCS